MSGKIIVQILCGIALLAGFVAVVVLFYKALRTTGEKVSKQFLLIETILLVTTVCGLMLLWGWPKSITGFILISVLLTLLVNLPLAILIKLFMLIFPKKDK